MTSTTPVAWPIADLSFFAEHGSWAEAPEPAILNFEVEVGPPKRRRRTYLPGTRLQFQRIITSAELEDFLTWFDGNLKSGVYNFTATDPRTQESTEYQFLQVPTWRDVGPDLWRLQFSLRRVNITPATSLFGNDAFTKSLLHFNGTDGSLIFPDSNFGGVQRSWSPFGDADISTDDPKFGTGAYSGTLGGLGYLTTPHTPDLALRDQPFAIDLWFNCQVAVGGFPSFAGQFEAAQTPELCAWAFLLASDGRLRFQFSIGSTTFNLNGSTVFSNTVNTGWNHAAVSREGDTWRMFGNGAIEDVETVSGAINNITNLNLTVGRAGDVLTTNWVGELDEFRLSVGTHRNYTAAFTPNVVPYE